MERHGRRRVEQMGVPASKESKDKWRNIGVGEFMNPYQAS